MQLEQVWRARDVFSLKQTLTRHRYSCKRRLYQLLLITSNIDITVNMELFGELQQSQLLSLPPEIRNIIYRLVLVQRVMIPHGTFPIEPSLLRVSRQIRSEALMVFYKESHFRWLIRDFDARAYIAWCKASPFRLEVDSKWKIVGRRDWSNILEWLEAYYCKRCKAPRKPKGIKGNPTLISVRGAVICRLVRMVEKMRDEQNLAWAQIQDHLELVRSITGILNSQWKTPDTGA